MSIEDKEQEDAAQQLAMLSQHDLKLFRHNANNDVVCPLLQTKISESQT